MPVLEIRKFGASSICPNDQYRAYASIAVCLFNYSADLLDDLPSRSKQTDRYTFKFEHAWRQYRRLTDFRRRRNGVMRDSNRRPAIEIGGIQIGDRAFKSSKSRQNPPGISPRYRNPEAVI
jgi:hypothetical protein